MDKKYEVSGQTGFAVGNMITLFVGLAVVTLLLIFTGVLAGSTYQQLEDKIDAITNTTIKNAVKDSVVAGFEANKQGAEFLPIVTMAVIIALVMGLVLGFTSFSGRGGGTAL